MVRRTGIRALRGAAVAIVATVAALLPACGDDGADTASPPAVLAVPHPLLDSVAEVPVGSAAGSSAALDDEEAAAVDRLIDGLDDATALGALTVDYPAEGSVFPPDFAAPTLLWHDDVPAADTWLVRIQLPGSAAPGPALLVAGPQATEGEIDPHAVAETNEVYRFTPYQASARSWKPSDAVWATLCEHAGRGDAVLQFVGIASSDPATPLSRGRVRLRISKDVVGAPIFYRDVPLMPAVGESGVIQPLSRSALPMIAWRLKDVSKPGSRILLTGMPSCANCHSFSRDGRTLAMDIDGPDGDKGMYAIAPIEAKTTIGRDEVITWNSFPGRPEGHKTIGFLSRVSPDGQHVISTVNESLYVANFTDHRFLQVFYPTRGILAWYSKKTGQMRSLPGANDPKYVHCDGVWSPDGKTVVFARARAQDPYSPDRPLAKYPNDPNETQVRYDLYRLPFNHGRGGKPTPIAGASANGMSNTFPKVSPDGRWIVFTQCKNGQLMRPDGRLWIVPLEGGEAREMRCNTALMNSWHSFSPNGRWMVFSSKVNRPYTQMFLTHIDADGNDTPPILVEGATAANRAVNIPEFLNAPYDALQEIEVPAVNHHLWFQRGDTLLREGNLEEARPLLEKALAQEPDFSRAHASLALVLDRQGEAEQARVHYEKALDVDGRNPYVLTNLGLLLLQAGEVDRAMRLWRRALRINPHDAMAHNNMGMALARRNRGDEAAEHFRKALVVDPSFVAAHKNLGMLALKQERRAEATGHFEAAVRIDPRDTMARGYLVDLLMQAGRSRDVIPHLEALVDQGAEDARARILLAWHLATSVDDDLRDGRRAVTLAERGVELTGRRDPTALDALAAALAEVGEFGRAAASAETAARLAESMDREFAAEIRERKRVYESRRPHRERR